MTPGIAVSIVVVLALCAVGAYAASHWESGLKKRTVWCPLFKMHADILTRENGAASANTDSGLAPMDVKRCSLFKGKAARCEKECLQNL